MAELHLNLLTPKKLISKAEGRHLLHLLSTIYPDIAPERYGAYEPLRNTFDCANPEKALEDWQRLFFWNRRRPRVEGCVAIAWTPHPVHAWLSLSIKSQNINSQSLINFLKRSVLDLDADFACIHNLIEHDIASGVASKTVDCLNPQRQQYSLSVTTYRLVKYLPNLYWVTVFGPPYVEFFGRERILSCPAPMIHELENGSIYLQLCADFSELENNYDAFDAVRQAIKRHLNPNAYFDPTLPDDHIYATPKFRL